MISKAADEHRLKILLVPEDDVMGFMVACLKDYPKCAVFRRFKNVPEGAGVLRVGYEYAYRAFGFLLAHPSFEQVPPGAIIPFLVSESVQESIQFEPKKKNTLKV